MLYGATLRAEHPHARILSIDTSQARALPGVHAVLTHADVPGRNRHGLVYHDWPVLCDDKVRYLGDAVAIVAADTPEIAREALELIQVEYEPLPTWSAPRQAREPDAALVHEEWTPTATEGQQPAGTHQGPARATWNRALPRRTSSSSASTAPRPTTTCSWSPSAASACPPALTTTTRS